METVSSPQITSYVPVAPPTGMVIDWPPEVVLQVVINAPEVSFTITSTESIPESVPSLTVSLKVYVVSEGTSGAVNVVEAEEALAKVIPEPDVSDHLYDVMASPSGSVAVPDKVTVSPSPTVWSVPAFTVGGMLALSVTVISSIAPVVAALKDASARGRHVDHIGGLCHCRGHVQLVAAYDLK